MTKLEANGLMDFDADSVRSMRDSAEESRHASTSERFHVSDLTATNIKVNFASFGARGGKGKSVRQDILWNDLPADAARYADVAALVRLAQAEQILLRLTDHSRRDAVRVTGGR